MENYNNFDAKGQLIFVEPTWVTGETCLFNIQNPILYATAKTKLTNIRKKFLTRLENKGFIITYDKNDTTNDIVYLTMNELAICDEKIDDYTYKKEFDKRIFQAGGYKLNYPYTVTVDEYLNNPFLPTVFKNEFANGGIDKFLIETEYKVELIKKFYKNYSSKKEYYEAFKGVIFQQLIETPTKYATYIRVLMSASGDVMGASLKYSKVSEQKRELQGIFEQYFMNENSEYFLNCSTMFNYYSNGGNITFTQPKYSSEKQEILEAHGIDPNNPTIPNEILEVASSIVQNCNRELGIICGIDFILNKNDNKWYYLENQAFPAIEEWADAKGLSTIKVKNIDDYIKYNELDLEARYDALMMYMKKKLSFVDKIEQDKTKIYKL